jgi:hypothetical protein
MPSFKIRVPTVLTPDLLLLVPSFLVLVTFSSLPFLGFLSHVILTLSNVSCLLSLVSCPLSPVPCLLSLVSCPLSHVPCLLSLISCPLSPLPITCFLSPVTCLLSLVIRLLSSVSCHPSLVTCPLSPSLVSRHLSLILACCPLSLSLVTTPFSPVPCFLAHVMCPLSPVPCLLSLATCPPFPVPCHLPFICLLFLVTWPCPLRFLISVITAISVEYPRGLCYDEAHFSQYSVAFLHSAEDSTNFFQILYFGRGVLCFSGFCWIFSQISTFCWC